MLDCSHADSSRSWRIGPLPRLQLAPRQSKAVRTQKRMTTFCQDFKFCEEHMGSLTWMTATLVGPVGLRKILMKSHACINHKHCICAMVLSRRFVCLELTCKDKTRFVRGLKIWRLLGNCCIWTRWGLTSSRSRCCHCCVYGSKVTLFSSQCTRCMAVP